MTQLYIGIDIGYITKDSGIKLIQEAKEIAAMIASMIKIRKNSIKEEQQSYDVAPSP